MKKLIGILAVVLVLCLSMTVVSFAKTADIVKQSVEGTATIDGVKDDIYNSGLVLPFVSQGKGNGDGSTMDESIATAYIVNDAEYVYVFVDVPDDQLDNASSNAYEQDSVEVFWMSDNSKVQIRYHYDNTIDNDSGAADEYVVVSDDHGYAVELRLPITDVKDNQIEMCIQINVCTDGKRDYTCYIEGNSAGDDAWQRSNRQSEYDCWWTLALAGDHEDTRVDPEEQPMELTIKNYNEVRNTRLSASIHCQNNINWNDWAVWTTETMNIPIGETVEIDWTTFNKSVFDEENTNNFTVAPQFSIDINDASNYLKIASDAAEGDTGDSARFTYTYTDITLSSEGFDDVVIPGDTVSNVWEIYVPSWGGTAGAGGAIDLAAKVREVAGFSVEELVNFMANLTEVKTTVTFDSLNLVDIAALDEYAAQLDAEDDAKVEALQEYIDRVEAAKAVIADESADLAAKQDALNDANKAANRATKDAENYPKAEAKAAELVADVAEMTKTVDKLAAEEAAANAPAEKEPAEDNAPAASNKTPASSSSSSGSTTTIVIVIIAVVVIAAIAAAVVLGKKKKA